MLTTLLSPCNLPTPVNWKAFVECLPQGRPRPAMTTFKHSFHLISAPLANIINLSLRKGIFPDKLKIAKVILLTNQMILFILQTTDPFLCSPIFPNFLKK